MGGADQIGEELSGNFYVNECDVEGGWPFAGAVIFDVDPLFAVQRDPHLSTASPVQDIASGMFAGYPCTAWPWDVDGQLRYCGLSEIGADEVEPVTLTVGLPTDPLRLVGICGASPGSPVTLIVSPAIAATPLATPFGALEVVAQGALLVPFPPADAKGVSLLKIGLASLPAGTNVALQALVGGKLAPATTLLVR